MTPRTGTTISTRLVVCLCASLGVVLAACSDDAQAPHVAVAGGGFIFNYRAAEAYYGVSIKPMRRLADGTRLEASFEDPAGGPPIVVTETVAGAALGYSLQTPPLTGIKAGRDYKVVIRVLEGPARREVQRVEKTLRSDLDQDVLPAQPLTVGPVYTPNPANTDTPK